MDRPIVNPDIESYLQQVLGPSDEIALEMERLAKKRSFPIVGSAVGRLLELLARTCSAKRVFEMGSGFGYSTLFFARAVGEGGRVIYTDTMRSQRDEAHDFLERAGLVDRVRFLVGDALELLGDEPGPFDVVFCDIEKEDYPRAMEIAVPRLRVGGLLIYDNTLWHGRVADASPEDDSTRAVQALNAALHTRDDLLTSLVPLRDGVSVSLRLK